MNKFFELILLLPGIVLGQSYAPPAGQPGSTALYKDSSCFVAWASGIDVDRGYIDIENKATEINGTNRVSYGHPNHALGPVSGNSADVVSLGDSGVAILTFDRPVINGPGYDFAVFENSFSDDYLEFAHVEVSSDGERYVRFPSHSEVQSMVQIHGLGLTDTRRIHNLAGKYRAGFGTPFDLDELKDSVGLDVNNITHIKLIDVVGSIGDGGSYDSYGNKINEPYSTPYETGGFDLDGVGVIHQLLNVTSKTPIDVAVYPNPSRNGHFKIKANDRIQNIHIISSNGAILYQVQLDSNTFEFNNNLTVGIYFLQITTTRILLQHKLIVHE